MTKERFISEVKACQGSLRRFLTALCRGDAALADDLAQEALIRAYIASDRFFGPGKFKPWLFRIAYHCFIDKTRKTPLQELPEQLPGGPTADASFQYQALYHALGRLPDTERTVIALHYFEGQRIREIAEILQIPVGTVKYHLHQGRKHLKAYIHERD